MMMLREGGGSKILCLYVRGGSFEKSAKSSERA